MDYLVSLLGLVALFFGARMLIWGATSLGNIVGISPVVIGLTVVAYGTSTPELLVSVIGTYGGHEGLALGNVIGSNVFNVLFILGLSASLVPLVINHRLLHYDVPIIALLTLLVVGFAWNGVLSLVEGVILVVVLIGYTIWAVSQARTEQKAVENEFAREFSTDSSHLTTRSVVLTAVLIPGGLSFLVVGSRIFTESVSGIARSYGISETVIGLTVVSAGTSLPEVGTSVLAALRGEPDIAVGNVLGSNFFNLTGVLGCSMVVSGNGMSVSPSVFQFDFMVLILVSLLCFPILFTDHRITRPEGFLFLAYYAGYLAILLSGELISSGAGGGMFYGTLSVVTVAVGSGLVYAYRLLWADGPG